MKRDWIQAVQALLKLGLVATGIYLAFVYYDRWSAQLLDGQHAFVTPSSHAGRVNARFAILNPRTTFDDLVGILDTMK